MGAGTSRPVPTKLGQTLDPEEHQYLIAVFNSIRAMRELHGIDAESLKVRFSVDCSHSH